eukprot:COSAG02_NODE_5105_length_4624_cov_6.735691_8_plen_178_part_00
MFKCNRVYITCTCPDSTRTQHIHDRTASCPSGAPDSASCRFIRIRTVRGAFSLVYSTIHVVSLWMDERAFSVAVSWRMLGTLCDTLVCEAKFVSGHGVHTIDATVERARLLSQSGRGATTWLRAMPTGYHQRCGNLRMWMAVQFWLGSIIPALAVAPMACDCHHLRDRGPHGSPRDA